MLTTGERLAKVEQMTVFRVAVLNKSNKIQNGDAAAMTAACRKQLRLHVAPSWGFAVPAVSFVANEAELDPSAFPVYLLNDPDQANALGYHDETPAGRPYGRVFVVPCLDNGEQVSVTLSHELCELRGDPACNVWATAPDGYDYAQELGDPVEGDSYMVGRVAVSNFALPAWFDGQAQKGERFDYMGKLSAPFTMTPGGYVIRKRAGKVTEVYGEAFPRWKRDVKATPGARGFKRLRA